VISGPETSAPAGLDPRRERLGRWLLAAEDLRSRTLAAFDRSPVTDPRRWVARNGRATQRAFLGRGVRWAHVDGVLDVVLRRAPANEIGTEMLGELERLVAYLEAGGGGARAMLLRSDNPRGFSAGADLRELHRRIQDRKAAGVPLWAQTRELRSFIDRIHRVMDVLDRVPIPTVAALHGVVFGGGLELALTCDTLVADRTARFAFPELRLGLVPGFGGIPRLRRDLGNAVVRDLLLSGRSLRAARAHELGLVSQLAAPGEAPAVARAAAVQATRFDPRTTAAAKAFLKPFPGADLAREKALFTQLFASPVVEASLADFVASTDPMPYLPPRERRDGGDGASKEDVR